MARLIDQGGCRSSQLSQHWICLSVQAGAARDPGDLPAAADWRAASVPGTVATDRVAEPPSDLHAMDHWYRLDMALPGDSWLEFRGLTSIAEIWLDGSRAASSETMFVPLEVPVPAQGAQRIEICFRALRPVLRARTRAKRPRWRGRLAADEALRLHRTTLLGHMPSWSGDMPIIGPYRPVILHVPQPGAPVVRHVDLRTRLRADGSGVIAVQLKGRGLDSHGGTLSAGDSRAALVPHDGGLCGELVVRDPPLWWPHTHGEPATVPVKAEIDGCAIDLGRVGFRTIERRDPAAGFGLIVNGVPVFCRGAVWAGLDPTGRPAAPAVLRNTLQRARDAGFNMLRVTGMTLYETPEFFAECDALGIMVWHDFMFARFDYGDDLAFAALVRAEAEAFATSIQAHPSVAVLCGGTEVAQAAAMAGCPPAVWSMPLFEDTLAQAAAASRPDVLYLPHSPLGRPGELPFAAAAPVAHYFGVGGYLRPLADLAAAEIRFAAECLAFANPPHPSSCRAMAAVPGADPVWRGHVVRDVEASWHFEDVRDHYVQELFDVSAPSVRRRDPWNWLDLGRAAVAVLMQQAMATWRTDGRCAGAIVLMLHDLVPGAGWGVIGHDSRPKSALYALSSVCQPLQVLLRDLGQNGVVLHAINETATARQVRLSLRGLTADGAVEALGATVLALSPRENRAVPAMELMGRWRDLADAWQFGPPGFAALGATLDDTETGSRLSESTHFPGGPVLPRRKTGLTARLRGDADDWMLDITAETFAQFVQVDDDDFDATESHFHLWPGETRRVALQRFGARAGAPRGSVTALNSDAAAHYEMIV